LLEPVPRGIKFTVVSALGVAPDAEFKGLALFSKDKRERASAGCVRTAILVIGLALVISGIALSGPLRQSSATNRAQAYPLVRNPSGNPVEVTTTVHLIFLLPSTLQDGKATSLSSRYVNTVEQFFRDIGGTGLYGILGQYGVKNSVTYGGATANFSQLPSSCPFNADCISDTTVQGAISEAIASNGWRTGLSDSYLVYLPPGETVCKNVGLADCYSGTCPKGGYHDHFLTSFHESGDVVYGVIPYTAKCAFGPYSSDINSAVTFSAHEFIEAVTDPDLNAWQDPSGNEIGDLCASDVGLQPGVYDFAGANQKLYGHYYEVQAFWSNRAGGCVRNDGREHLADVTTAAGTSSGRPGTVVDIGGEDFRPGESVSISYFTGLKSPKRIALCAPPLAGSTTTVRSDSSEKDDEGFANTDNRTVICQTTIPQLAGAPGPHRITIVGSSSHIRTSTIFTVR
jgi:hypothetical protein